MGPIKPKSSLSLPSSIRDDDNPYVGPRAFGDRDPLYGRDRELRELVDLLIAERIVVLHSPSGAGKTSLIHAEDGLLRELQRQRFKALPPVRVNLQPPGTVTAVAGRYAYSIMAALESARKTKRQLTKGQLSSMTLAQYLDQTPAVGSQDSEVSEPVVLILDQFEEVFTLDPTDAAGRQQFFADLGVLLKAKPIWVLFAMRGDLLGELEAMSHLIPGDLASRYRLGLLERPAAREAIMEPARRRHDVNFTPEAADRLLDNVCTILVKSPGGDPRPHASPYVEGVILQTVLLKLWQRLDPVSNGLKIIKPDDLGNLLNHVDRALASHYHDSVEQATEVSQIPERVIRDWFENQLITEQGWRNPADQGPGKGGRRSNQCLDVLEAQHIIRSETRLNRQWWELVHDRFLNPVMDDNRRWRRKRELDAIPAAAKVWSNDKRDELLLPADRVVGGVAWLQAHQVDAYEVERQFIAASEKAARAAIEPSTSSLERDLDADYLLFSDRRISEQYLLARRAYDKWWYVSLALAIVVLVLLALLVWQNR